MADDLDSWIARTLPARPDPDSGEPRPPASVYGAPARSPWPASGPVPSPPPGRGRALECGYRIPWQFVITLALVGASAGFFLWTYLIGPDTWIERGLHLTALIWAALVGFVARIAIRDSASRVAVGADWLRAGRTRWVDLYSLNSVRLRGGLRNGIYLLRDTAGRRATVSASIMEVDGLRELVVNGIRHSWHRGAAVDDQVRGLLGLADGPAWRWFESPRRAARETSADDQ